MLTTSYAHKVTFLLKTRDKGLYILPSTGWYQNQHQILLAPYMNIEKKT